MHLILGLLGGLFTFIHLLDFDDWSRLLLRLGPVDVILLLAGVFTNSGAAVVENLVFGEDLVFWNVDLLISLIIVGAIGILLNNLLPVFVVHIH